jgi:hypothetical protein
MFCGVVDLSFHTSIHGIGHGGRSTFVTQPIVLIGICRQTDQVNCVPAHLHKTDIPIAIHNQERLFVICMYH